MIEQVTPPQFAQWLARQPAGSEPVLLDVREPGEWAVASVAPPAGCSVVQMSMHTVPARMTELDRQRPIACLCHHGGRSMQVAFFLANQGYTKIANIAGGIDAWAREVDPSVARY